jgi:hypothetical protein
VVSLPVGQGLLQQQLHLQGGHLTYHLDLAQNGGFEKPGLDCD